MPPPLHHSERRISSSRRSLAVLLRAFARTQPGRFKVRLVTITQITALSCALFMLLTSTAEFSKKGYGPV